MTKILFYVILSSFLIFFFISKATIVDDVLLIPMTETVPIIDGQLDVVWHNVTNTHMEKFADDMSPDNWLDYSTSFRLMWDEDYLYLFMHFMDDTAQIDSPVPKENDGCELYNVADDYREWWWDVSWRYVYDKTEYWPGTFDCGVGAWCDTEYGYNFELAIPESSLTFECIPDQLIAFEIQWRRRPAILSGKAAQTDLIAGKWTVWSSGV